VRLATFNLLGGRSVAHGRVEEDELRSAAASLDADSLPSEQPHIRSGKKDRGDGD